MPTLIDPNQIRGGTGLIRVVAWAVFGVSSNVVTYRDKSSNITISSIATGDYLATFSPALNNANYAVSMMVSGGLLAYQRFGAGSPSATQFYFATADNLGVLTEPAWCSIVVMGT